MNFYTLLIWMCLSCLTWNNCVIFAFKSGSFRNVHDKLFFSHLYCIDYSFSKENKRTRFQYWSKEESQSQLIPVLPSWTRGCIVFVKFFDIETTTSMAQSRFNSFSIVFSKLPKSNYPVNTLQWPKLDPGAKS